MHFLEAALRFGSAGVAERLIDVASRVQGPLAATLRQLGEAVVAGDGARFDAVAAAFAGLGMDIHAAEAATWAARSHREAGASGPALASSDRAEDLLARCEGARTPALAVTGGGGPDELTRREREVALLAVKGLSSRTIAERLAVSVRTIDNQLGRAYRKLGVTSRAELRARAGELGLD
jgi:DNA-binding CsgD family transcriptional regulator